MLNRRNKSMFLIPTGCVAEDIKVSIVHIALSISIYKVKSLYTNVNRIWTH